MPRRRRTRSAVAVTALATVVLAGACSDEPERSVAAYCSQVQAIATLDADLATGDPVRIQARADDLRALRQVAPGEIEPAVGVLLGITDDFARTAGTATDRADVADEVFRGRSDEIASIEAAGEDVATYTAANCRIALDGSGSTSLPGSQPAPPPDSGTGSGSGSGSGDPSTTAPPSGDPSSTTTSTPSLLVE